ncbi:homoserine kinase [mine drainage metagenome]|uniref:Homoserine kinase n=1 Tax=mine drainage metagenome TaxID=410659 RepID=A0A1J5S3R9_9ZZZZ
MAVFTRVTEQELAAWLTHYDLGTLTGMQDIPSGTDNTNYFIALAQGGHGADKVVKELVLTIFEHLTAEQIPFYLGLMAHFAKEDFPVPLPIVDRLGKLFSELMGKPAALVARMRGHWIETPTAAQCGQLGHLLGRMHLSGQGYAEEGANRCGIAWHQRSAAAVLKFLDPDEQELLRSELAVQTAFDQTRLPCGAIHADLFRDNVLWQNGIISGILDYYYAFTGALLYDLAVTVNDWCIDDRLRFNGERLHALLSAYRSERPLSVAELDAWPMELRRAALRFWLSRLYDFHLPHPSEIKSTKDPDHFRDLLIQHIRHPASISA